MQSQGERLMEWGDEGGMEGARGGGREEGREEGEVDETGMRECIRGWATHDGR